MKCIVNPRPEIDENLVKPFLRDGGCLFYILCSWRCNGT